MAVLNNMLIGPQSADSVDTHAVIGGGGAAITVSAASVISRERAGERNKSGGDHQTNRGRDLRTYNCGIIRKGIFHIDWISIESS